jgi:hypothetical protein
MSGFYKDGDFPSPSVSVGFRAPGFSASVAICSLLYMTTFIGIQFFLRFKKTTNKEFVECQKKAWIMILNILSVYLWNRVSVATTIILWFATFAHVSALLLCILESQREKLFKKVFAAAIGISLFNWLIHWITRVSTKGITSIHKGILAQIGIVY